MRRKPEKVSSYLNNWGISTLILGHFGISKEFGPSIIMSRYYDRPWELDGKTSDKRAKVGKLTTFRTKKI